VIIPRWNAFVSKILCIHSTASFLSLTRARFALCIQHGSANITGR